MPWGHIYRYYVSSLCFSIYIFPFIIIVYFSAAVFFFVCLFAHAASLNFKDSFYWGILLPWLLAGPWSREQGTKACSPALALSRHTAQGNLSSRSGDRSLQALMSSHSNPDNSLSRLFGDPTWTLILYEVQYPPNPKIFMRKNEKDMPLNFNFIWKLTRVGFWN